MSYEHYAANRGADMALPRHTLLPISVPAGTQPCTTFALHSKLPGVQQMYSDGDVAFVANMGNLIEPMNAEEYREYEQ